MSVEQSYAGASPDEPALLRRFGIDESALLGAGGEARVFALPDGAHVLRAGGPTDDLGLRELLDGWASVDLGFALPRVVDTGVEGELPYSIDVRLPGVHFGRWLSSTADADLRHRALLSSLDAAARLGELPLPRPGFGRPLDRHARFASLTDLLAAQIDIGLFHAGPHFRALVPELDEVVARVLDELAARDVAPAFVHADFCPANTLVDAVSGQVSAVLDISVHSLAADPVLTEVAAVAFVELTPYPANRADAARLEPVLRERLGDQAWLIDAYRRFYALYYAMDSGLWPWCTQQLSRLK